MAYGSEPPLRISNGRRVKTTPCVCLDRVYAKPLLQFQSKFTQMQSMTGQSCARTFCVNATDAGRVSLYFPTEKHSKQILTLKGIYCTRQLYVRFRFHFNVLAQLLSLSVFFNHLLYSVLGFSTVNAVLSYASE